ncbi:MAG: cell envelope integrity protein TolA [Gammaproteobacteria bacterium]|nr:cell envelope integrity protein TolA [Gammaproteobacteria bacterium]
MSGRRSDPWVAGLMSVLVHAAIVALLGWGWWLVRRPAPAAQQLAIEARVIDSATLARLRVPRQPSLPQPQPLPQPPSPEPPVVTPAPQPSRAEQQRLAEQERRAELQRRAAQQARVEQERAERLRIEKQQAEAARAEAQRQARAAAQQQAAAREQRQQQERRQAEAERAQREAELRAQLAAEERINAARGSAQQAEYQALIEARIARAWIRPATARVGIHCQVRVTQVPGGEVVGVQLGRCNGDAAVRESIEAAVYRASPLPQPPNPDLFDRNLVVTFAPND